MKSYLEYSMQVELAKLTTKTLKVNHREIGHNCQMESL